MTGDIASRTTLRRSQLVVPGRDEEVLHNAAESRADEVILDLEDSVPAREKAPSRDRIVDAIVENDWRQKIVSCRINSLNTKWWYDDVIDLVTQAGQYIDALIVPKTDSGQTVNALETLLAQVEANAELRNGAIALEAQIESARGMSNISEIAGSSDLLETLIFGPGDYSASIGVGGLTTGHSDTYPGHYWHYPLSRIAHFAKGSGLQAIDGLYADFEDEGGFREACQRAKMVGCDGKWVIHPRQVEIANQAFAPNQEEARLATEIVETYEQARQDGQQTATFDGELIDKATYQMAETIVERAKQAGVWD